MNRRLPIIVLLIVALVATGLTRQLASDHRGTNRLLGAQRGDSSGAQLTQMNSFALTLLLGGLRGPLVMILWSSSESQKSERNLEDFDTKVEWIRLLQPEFDSVHIFQIWNKAYNISVQMASWSNKYSTILDAVEYARKVNAERPDNINILYALGSIFGDKLGGSMEKTYYRRRVREETLPHPSKQKLNESDPGYRRLQLDAMLDEKGNVLDKYLQATSVHLVDPNIPTDVYDGSELPFLKPFQPYPYGLDPQALGYNYRKRTQLLLRLAKQKHAQLSDLVLDSRPALDLKLWGDAEWDHGRRMELKALNREVPPEHNDMEAAGVDVSLSASFSDASKAQFRDAIFSYGLAQRLWKQADAEYVEHLRRFSNNYQMYASHRDELAAGSWLLKGDENFLLTLLAPPDQRATTSKLAIEAYQHAKVRYALIILHYYVYPEVTEQLFPKGVTKDNFPQTLGAHPDELSPSDVLPLLKSCIDRMTTIVTERMPSEISEYTEYIRRADSRVQILSKQ